MKTYCLELSRIREHDHTHVGGKALNLGRLQQQGVSVPKGFVLTTVAYEEFISNYHLDVAIANGLQNIDPDDVTRIQEVSNTIQQRFLECTLPPQPRLAFEHALQTLQTTHVAVRSSATVEDSAKHTWAGQFDSFTHVKKEECAQYVVRCFASLFSSRAIRYGLLHKVSFGDMRMAVLLQHMVWSDASGVVFSESPDQDGAGRMLVEGVLGLGEGLVAGILTPDSYLIDKKTLAIVNRTVACKLRALQYDVVKNTVIWHTVPTSKANAPIMTEALCRELCTIVRHIEQQTGAPVDVEWAVTQERVWILQSRRITTLEPLMIYDSSNIAESYAGVTTPLTFSFIRYVYEGVYKEFCNLVGVGSRQVQARHNLFAHMVEYIGSHVYYNLRNWHAMIALFPGYQVSRTFMEHMMGVDPKYRGTIVSPTTHATESVRNILSMTYRGCMVVWVFTTLPFRLWRFNARFDVYESRVRAMDIETMDSDTLHRLYQTLDRDLIRAWRAPIANDFAVMVSEGLCTTLTKHNPIHMTQSHVLGKKPLKSVAPGFELAALSNLIISDPDLRTLFNPERTPDVVWHELKISMAHSLVTKKIVAYIDRFGTRIPHDLKLESIPYREDPLPLIRLLQHSTKNISPGPSSIPAQHATGRQVRSPSLSRYAYTLARRWNSTATAQREEARIRRNLAFDLVRRIVRRAGVIIHNRHIINDPEDIFFLTIEELFTTLLSENHVPSFVNLVTERKRVYNQSRKISIPRRIETRMPLHMFEERLFTHAHEVKNVNRHAQKISLSGTVSSKGDVGTLIGIATVMIEFDPCADFRGRVLVTRYTDPGWTIIFPLLRGIIVERGGMLSHASVVARELNIPCIIGVEHATRDIPNGATVTINTSTGTITFE